MTSFTIISASYLNNSQTRDLMRELSVFFERTVEIPRMKIGSKQTIETLIGEEALILAKFLGNEQKMWSPRITI